jgi:hypothetical protein
VAGRFGVVLAVVAALAPVGCSRRPLAEAGDAAVVPGADGASDVARDVVARDTTPDAAPDVSRDVVAAEATPDVSRDVVAETPPDVAADAPRDSVVGGDADRPGDGGTVPTGRALSLMANWAVTQTSGSRGLTVDAANRVFRADAQYVYLFEGGQFRTYMSIAGTVSGLGMSEPAGFIDIDTGSDGLLYVLLYGGAGDTSPSGMVVAGSSSAHVAKRLLDFRSTEAGSMRVIAPGKVGISDIGGMWTATTAGQQLVYGYEILGNPFTCLTTGRFAVNSAGLFLFNVGCDGSALLRGNLDGSGVIPLYQPNASPVSADRFTCLARDPAGGFYVMVTGDGTGTTPTSGTRLYHLADDASGTSGFTRVGTTPSFDQARRVKVDQSVFTTCALAAAPDGTVYVQTVNELWKIAP